MNKIFEIRKAYQKATEEDLKVLKFIHDHFKTHVMFQRCVFILEYVSDHDKTQKMCEKVVNRFPFMLQYCCNKYEAHKMCEKVIDSYFPDRYKTRKICEKAFHCSFSSALSFPSAFVTPNLDHSASFCYKTKAKDKLRPPRDEVVSHLKCSSTLIILSLIIQTLKSLLLSVIGINKENHVQRRYAC